MSLQRTDYSWFHPLRVRYSEIDYQGVVFNAHYLTYFDVALTEYLRTLAFDFVALVREENLDFHLIKSTVEYRRPIRVDQLIEIGVKAARVGRSSVTWQLGIFAVAQDECLATGEIIWVCATVGEHQSHPLPATFRRTLEAAASA